MEITRDAVGTISADGKRLNMLEFMYYLLHIKKHIGPQHATPEMIADFLVVTPEKMRYWPPTASEIGRKGGNKRSPAQVEASNANIRKGWVKAGRPFGSKNKIKSVQPKGE